MCTAVFCPQQGGFFGRTLDLERVYNETVTIIPRRYVFDFRHEKTRSQHYAMIGMATVAEGYPLYYDAVNERGLCAAALNFPHSGAYAPVQKGRRNIASFELIPFLLAQCGCVEEVEQLLAECGISNVSFNNEYTATALHWMIADGTRCIVVESGESGVHVYPNVVGVMTNEPPFLHQLTHLCQFARLTNTQPPKAFFGEYTAIPHSRGLGAVGLPGDFSSPSRFVRAAFVLAHTTLTDEAIANVGQVFKMLGTVEVPRGCVLTQESEEVITQYTSCMDARRGIYYYKTYGNSRISAVRLHAEELEGDTPISYPLYKDEDVRMHN